MHMVVTSACREKKRLTSHACTHVRWRLVSLRPMTSCSFCSLSFILFSISRETCLHVASFDGNVAAARYLLSVDADPNSAHTASGFNTPLHEAARSGSLAVTRLLLKSSANVLAVNSHGDHPLHVACREGRLDITRRLLAHDSDWATVTARNHAGLRPSEVVSGCWALTSLLAQLEVSAAKDAKAKANMNAVAADATDVSSTPAFRQQNNNHSSSKRGAAATPLSGVPGGTGTLGGGRGRGRRGGLGVAALRRPGVRKGHKPGLVVGSASTSKDAVAMALLSGSILPRWTRLARPVDEAMHRQRRPLDGRDRHHGQQNQRGLGHWPAGEGEEGGGGGGEVGEGGEGINNNNVGSIVSEESEAQSAASWSGTSYGASLTESDFGIPSPSEAFLENSGCGSGWS